MAKLNSVKLMFENSKYNYTTSVSSKATKERCENFFVGKYLNIGEYPLENIQVCIGIEFTDNNKKTV